MGAGIPLLDRIVPQNAAFRGMVDGDQIINTVVIQTSATLNETNTAGQKIILCDCTSNSITINLPTAVDSTAQFIIKKIDSTTNTVTIEPYSSETIDGSLNAVIYVQNVCISIVSNDANWFII